MDKMDKEEIKKNDIKFIFSLGDTVCIVNNDEFNKGEKSFVEQIAILKEKEIIEDVFCLFLNKFKNQSYYIEIKYLCSVKMVLVEKSCTDEEINEIFRSGIKIFDYVSTIGSKKYEYKDMLLSRNYIKTI